MELPKISYPTLSIKLPPNNKEFHFRPMLVKEEKLLLMAKTTQDEKEILKTIKQVVNNCALDKSFKVNSIPLFCLQFIFINLRGFSIGNLIEVSYRDFSDNKVYNFEIDLKDVIIKYPEIIDFKIPVTSTSGIIMKYPPASLYDNKSYMEAQGQAAFDHLILRCIDTIYNGDEIASAEDFEDADLIEFLELLDIPSFGKIKNFLLNLPTLYYKLSYKNSKDEEKVIELITLSDFFTLA